MHFHDMSTTCFFIRDQTKEIFFLSADSRKKMILKLSIFADTDILPKECLSAEREYFCRYYNFLQKLMLSRTSMYCPGM